MADLSLSWVGLIRTPHNLNDKIVLEAFQSSFDKFKINCTLKQWQAEGRKCMHLRVNQNLFCYSRLDLYKVTQVVIWAVEN